MNKNSRMKNSSFNFITNSILQVISILTAFVLRRVFISTLGIEFLGIAGLFNNILAVLSLAEMGVGTAMSYSMYKEIANNNTEKLTQLNNYYRVIYNRIAIFVFIAGVCILPFLQYIVNLDIDVPHLYHYYILELLSVILSYLFVYKITIVNADQSGYKLNLLGIALQLLTCVFQIAALLIFKKYMLYLIIGIAVTLFNNFVRSWYAGKWYPFINDKTKELPEEEKKSIWKNIKSMFAYKIGGVILNNTDNILISILVSTVMVGIYSNYLMLYNKANACISVLFVAILASIGNFNANANSEEKYKMFKIVDFMAYISYSIFAIGVFFCGHDIVKAVTGSTTLLLSQDVLIVTIVYFYINMLKRAIAIFRETTGLFKYGKYSMIISAVLNIVFSIVLGKMFGIFGILLATSIARCLSDLWYEPYILYKKIFNVKVREYFVEQFWRLLIIIAIILFIIPIINLNQLDNLYIKLLINGIICILIPSVIFFVLFHNSDEFKYLMSKTILIVKKALKRSE